MSRTVKQGSGDVAKKQRRELKTKQDAVGPRTKQIDTWTKTNITNREKERRGRRTRSKVRNRGERTEQKATIEMIKN